MKRSSESLTLSPSLRRITNTGSSKIDGYLNSNGSYFVIVGAGHLVGKRGIIELIFELKTRQVSLTNLLATLSAFSPSS